jgi:hypothetical protein
MGEAGWGRGGGCCASPLQPSSRPHRRPAHPGAKPTPTPSSAASPAALACDPRAAAATRCCQPRQAPPPQAAPQLPHICAPRRRLPAPHRRHAEPWPVLEEVTAASLHADLEGCALRAAEAAGECRVPEELKRFPQWGQCTEWAYASEWRVGRRSGLSPRPSCRRCCVNGQVAAGAVAAAAGWHASGGCALGRAAAAAEAASRLGS